MGKKVLQSIVLVVLCAGLTVFAMDDHQKNHKHIPKPPINPNLSVILQASVCDIPAAALDEAGKDRDVLTPDGAISAELMKKIGSNPDKVHKITAVLRMNSSGKAMISRNIQENVENKASEKSTAERINTRGKLEFSAASFIDGKLIHAEYEFACDMTEDIINSKNKDQEKISSRKTLELIGSVNLHPGQPIVAGAIKDGKTARLLILTALIAD